MKTFIHFIHAVVLLCLLASTQLPAEERIEMQGSAIRGNRELPKFMTILPWKPAELPDMNTPPINSLIDEALEPVERASFRRELYYYNQFSADAKTTD